MAGETEYRAPTLLERLDLALAQRLVERVPAEGPPEQAIERLAWAPTVEQRQRWIVGTLGLRGLRVRVEDVDNILTARRGRILPEHQEFKLVRGLDEVFAVIEMRANTGRLPDGWFIVECFKRATNEVGRFHNNVLRRDEPWDGLRLLRYPAPEQIGAMLDKFHPGGGYGESVEAFEALHPVRRAYRLMWRFARLAPFPDFNLSFGFVAATAYLRAMGYPLPIPEWSDRDRLERVVQAGPPNRALYFERRLLDLVAPEWLETE